MRGLRCLLGLHDDRIFLLRGDQRLLVEACCRRHCLRVNRIQKLSGRELREFNRLRRNSKIPWPTINVPFRKIAKTLAKNEKARLNPASMRDEIEKPEQEPETKPDPKDRKPLPNIGRVKDRDPNLQKQEPAVVTR